MKEALARGQYLLCPGQLIRVRVVFWKGLVFLRQRERSELTATVIVFKEFITIQGV